MTNAFTNAQLLPLAAIQPDASYNIREKLDARHIQEFKELYESDGLERLPPLLVMEQAAGKYTLLDGFHRYTALQQLGQNSAYAIVRSPAAGSQPARWALEQAIAANAAHGKPLTQSERRQLAARLFEIEPSLSTTDVARLTGISQSTASRVKQAGYTPEAKRDSSAPDVQDLARKVVRDMLKLYDNNQSGFFTKRLNKDTAQQLARACIHVWGSELEDYKEASDALTQIIGALDDALNLWQQEVYAAEAA